MNISMMKSTMAAAAALAMAGCAMCPHPDSGGWEDVFDKDLSNAEMPTGSWKYDADGWLTPATGDTILSKKDYGSVVVDLVYVAGRDANSGLFLYDTEHPKKKFEVQIMDDRSPVFADVKPYQRTGSIYGRCPAAEVRSRPAGEENRMTVWCEGDHVRVVVNGREVVDTDISTYVNAEVNPDGTPIPPYHKGFPALATIPRHGRIGLQGIHNTESAVRFKYVKVKELRHDVPASAAGTRPAMRLACQLWSVKDLWAGAGDKLAAFSAIFPRLKAMGYDGVQSAAFLDVDPAGLEKLLKENGLVVVDQPVRRIEDLEDESKLARLAAFCERFGVDFVYVPWFKSETIEGWKGLCRRLETAEAKLEKRGIRVGYHNHLREFTRLKDGALPWDALVSAGGARLEMDIGPVLESGRSPACELRRMKGRLPGGIHVKPVGATAVGAKGDRQDWPAIVAAADDAGVEWLVVECEKRQNTYEDVETSARTLRPLVAPANVSR